MNSEKKDVQTANKSESNTTSKERCSPSTDTKTKNSDNCDVYWKQGKENVEDFFALGRDKKTKKKKNFLDDKEESNCPTASAEEKQSTTIQQADVNPTKNKNSDEKVSKDPGDQGAAKQPLKSDEKVDNSPVNDARVGPTASKSSDPKVSLPHVPQGDCVVCDRSAKALCSGVNLCIVSQKDFLAQLK